MTQEEDSQRPIDRGDSNSPQNRLKEDVREVDDSYEPVGSREDWEADMQRSNNAVLEGQVPIHITSTGTRYVRVLDVPLALQDEFADYLTVAAVPVVENEESLVAFETDWLDWHQHRRSDRQATHYSAATSAEVMRTFPSIARQWGFSDIEMASLLGLSVRTYSEWSATSSHATLQPEQLKCASNTLGIYRSLTILFPRREQQQRWLHSPIDHAPFHSDSPMTVMHRDGLAGLRSPRHYLDAKRQEGFA
ncbi:antitoxin Xre-like helix-turn-helix domain-containing protein [Vreelandella arcis]|uniref:Antitoxin Xre-like helix-turn-helix domain-containing protein n=1 Tax=Vreelandella arcis TaxID=416873 RepID=A0A1G9XPR7_9GAMM|nr:antitoxin Xre-like helix-turn-helix domain-containing protein [Halomonas arcis]SDM98511.1 hypothetical protein SAMN04487951_101361 [Halomonas arcis]